MSWSCTECTSAALEGSSEPVRERLLDDLEDLVADELVVLQQGLAERCVAVAVLGEHLADALPLAGQDVLHALFRRGVRERLAPQDRAGRGDVAGRRPAPEDS